MVHALGGLISEGGLVVQEESLIAVVAHDLLNSMTSIQGLLSTAQTLVEQRTADQDRLAHLLQLAHLEATNVSGELQRLARRLPYQVAGSREGLPGADHRRETDL